MLQSGGELLLAETAPHFGPTTTFSGGSEIRLVDRYVSYGAIYEKQLWVRVLVRKRALATRRLPFKTYRRTEQGRDDARDTPLAQLLSDPNPRHSGEFLWEWTSSTFDIYGEAFWLKLRNQAGVPVELWPVHPSNLAISQTGNKLEYVYGKGILSRGDAQFVIPERDIVHFRSYNPASVVRGTSPLEALRDTLANEDAARRATTAFWRNGGRPSVALSHPKTLSPEAMARLRADWERMHAGADNFGKVAILEEGMTPQQMSLNGEEAQYVETRKLNREEVCAVYDTPPPVVHILERSTFNNVTELMRSMYRDTMAPHLGGFESTVAHQLTPEFGDRTLYCEFLMDEVLRGAFETRATAYQQAINAGWITPAEVRELENLPFIEGSDRLLINSTMIPVEGVDDVVAARQDIPLAASLTPTQLRTLHGRLSRQKSLDEVDPETFVAGLNDSSDAIRDELAEAVDDDITVAEFRERLRCLVVEDATDPMLELAKSIANQEPPVVNVSVGGVLTEKVVERDERDNIVRIVEKLA